MTNAERNAPCIDAELIARASQTVERLKSYGLSIVTAESCTGGLISAVLAHTQGAGEVLHGSFVAYSKGHKVKALGVEGDLLQREGAVNHATASQMLTGALAHSPADVALAITGVLGPDPDEDGNPVGLVFLAAGRRGHAPHVQRYDYGTLPPDILRRSVVVDALTLVESLL